MSAPCPTLGFLISVQMLRGSIMSLITELAPLLEAQGLTFHARGANGNELQVTRDGSQTTEADRHLVMEWAATWSDRARLTVSGVFDLSEPR